MPALDPLKNINPNEVLYQRRCANYVFVAPSGLRELMSDMTREVLRTRPENVCCFIADYLETLMVTREHARIAMKFVDRVAGQGVTVSNLLTGTTITKHQAEKAARIIQRAVRAYLLRRKKETGTVTVSVTQKSERFNQDDVVQKILRRTKISHEQADHAARVIQAAYRGYRRRMQDSVEHTLIDWRAASNRTIDVFKSTGPSRDEMHQAATCIKSAYRGFYTRRLIRILLAKKTKINQLLSYSFDLGTLEKAATIIQRAVRIYLMKRRCRENPEDCPPDYIRIVSRQHLALKHSEGVVRELIDEAMEVIKSTHLLDINQPSQTDESPEQVDGVEDETKGEDENSDENDNDGENNDDDDNFSSHDDADVDYNYHYPKIKKTEEDDF